MKNLFFILAFFAANFSFAQYSIKVKESKEDIGGGKNKCLTVTIYETTTDEVEKAWEKLMKSYDAKVSSKKEIFADNALIKDLTNNTVDVFAKSVKKSDNEIEFIVAVDLGGAFLNSSEHSSPFKAMEKIVRNFAKKATLDGLDNKLNAQQKVFDKRQKEFDGLVKEKEKLEKEIENYKEKIKKAEDDIKKNLDEQSAKQKEVDAEKAKLDELNKLKDKVD
ncbi:MAG TPA: hypothetical protein PKG63_09110 [Bacteroidales bacterium]|jgi:hypothetical protein|nr:hypothetical protein [Bacteroidales bacterium]HNV96619.1 hypothetical protein [Bacteroidales bacterium]